MNVKKILLLVLLAALLLPVFAQAATVKTQYSDGSLVVRSGPGTSYEPASWVKNGQSITVLEKGSTWSKIKVDSNGKTGFIKTKYIVSGSSSSENILPTYELGTVTTRYAASRVNLRKGPGTAYAVVDTLRRGALLFVKETKGNWYRVHTVAGDEGWISKNYVADGAVAETTANVNLRKGPGTGNAVIKVLPDGTDCTALAVDGDWTKVRCGKTTGWVYSRYITY